MATQRVRGADRLRSLLIVVALASAVIPLLTWWASAADSFVAKVVGVSDGDTITVLRNGRDQVKVRLEGIDCPEDGQDFARRAKEFTSSLTFGRGAEVKGKALDRNRRLLARVIVDGKDVSVELVKGGARMALQALLIRPDPCAEQERAREARRGLWEMPSPVPPLGLPATSMICSAEKILDGRTLGPA